MRQDLNKIEKVLDKHSYSINNIICDVMKTFNFKTLCWTAGAKKEDGYSVSEIITLLIIFPLMLLKSADNMYQVSKIVEVISKSSYLQEELSQYEKNPDAINTLITEYNTDF